MSCGIYMIKCTASNKVYIGHSSNIQERWNEHVKTLDKSHKRCNSHLLNEWNKYGSDSFTFTLIEECEIPQLEIREQFWIDYYNSKDRKFGYNINDATGSPSRIPEVRKKISETLKGRKITYEQRKRHLEGIRKSKRAVSYETAMKVKEVVESKYHSDKEIREVAQRFGISRNSVYAIRDGYHWIYRKDVEYEAEKASP